MNNSETIVRQLHEAVNNHDLNKVRQLLHPQYYRIGTDGKRSEGPQTGIENIAMYLNAFPDLKLDIKNIISSGDNVLMEYNPHGTFKGKLMDIDPTNRVVNDTTVCEVFEVRDNRIYAEREYFDTATFLKELGVQRETVHAG